MLLRWQSRSLYSHGNISSGYSVAAGATGTTAGADVGGDADWSIAPFRVATSGCYSRNEHDLVNAASFQTRKRKEYAGDKKKKIDEFRCNKSFKEWDE